MSLKPYSKIFYNPSHMALMGGHDLNDSDFRCGPY